MESPGSVTAKQFHIENFFGYRSLMLALHLADPHILKTRSLYANIYDSKQQFDILRAAYVNLSTVTKKDLSSLNVACRFVEIPHATTLAWMESFNGVASTFHRTPNSDLPIRRLYIEWDYSSCVFDRLWQDTETEASDLRQRWEHIWQAMTRGLQEAPMITSHIDEDFSTSLVEADTSVYNFHVYPPFQE